MNDRLEKLAVNLQTTETAEESSNLSRQPTQSAAVVQPVTITPPSSFTPRQISGSGQAASERIHLYPGLYVFGLSHEAQGHFAIWLLDHAGEKVELLANTTEPLEGSKAVHISYEGDYVFDVAAEGTWRISVGSPELDPERKSFDGSNQAATKAFQLDSGLRIFRMTYAGTGHFAVWLLDHVGNKVELLANESGSLFDSLGVPPSEYRIRFGARP